MGTNDIYPCVNLASISHALKIVLPISKRFMWLENLFMNRMILVSLLVHSLVYKSDYKRGAQWNTL